MKSTSLAVVIPAYNQGPFLKEAIDSVLGQREAPEEFIVSNNHSTDITAKVLSMYEDRVRTIMPPQHLPACEHGDFLISHCQSDWVAVLSSDDAALPNYVSDFKRTISRYGNKSVLCRGGVLFIDNESNFIADRRLLSVRKYEDGFLALKNQLNGPKVFFAGFCVKRSAFQKVGGFKDYEAVGDWPLWLELCAEGGFCHTESVISRYRLNDRQGLHRKRLPGAIRDEWRMRSEVIPRVLASIGKEIAQTDLKLIARRRLIYGLNSCLKEQINDAEVNLTDVIDAWADYAHARDIVKRYRSGELCDPETPYLSRLRERITPCARALISRLRP